MKDAGITNGLTQTAILSVVSKESEFNPAASEVSYAKTSNDRIRKIFSKTKSLSDAQLNALKSNSKKFFDFIYNGVAGNGPNDGYRYRGRGFNQLTGRANYANISKLTGIDFLNKPELLSEPGPAAKAAVAYFKQGAETLKKTGKLSWYNATNINDFKSLNDSLKAIYHINAGAGYGKKHIEADVTGGLAKTMARGGSLLELVGATTEEAIAAVKTTASEAMDVAKKNPLTSVLIGVLMAAGTICTIKAISLSI